MVIYTTMDTYMHKAMASVVSLEKIEIIRSQEFMPSEARLKFLQKMIILGPKTAILGPQFWWSGGPPGSAPVTIWPPHLINDHTRTGLSRIEFKLYCNSRAICHYQIA